MNELPIFFEQKDMIGLLLLVAATAIVTAGMLFFPRVRDLGLFLIVGGAVFTTKFDLNIYSAYWYRGTTRGFEVTLVDVFAIGLLISAVLLPRPGQLRWYWPGSIGLMLLFTAFCGGTLLALEPAVFGLYEFSKLIRGIIFFMAAALVVRTSRELGIVVVALSFVVFYEAAFALRERYLLGLYRAGGTLQHPNSLSMYLCMVTPILVAAGCSNLHVWVRRICWAAVVPAAIALLLTLSRAGLPVFACTVGGAFVLCASWRPTFGKLVLGTLAVAVIGIMAIKAWPHIMARYGEATLEEEYFESGEGRGYYFRQVGIILNHKPFGVGLNNWSYWVSREYGAPLGMRYEDYHQIGFAPSNNLLYMYRYAAPAHNLGVLTVGEIGWIGFALLLAMFMRWLQMGMSFLWPRNPEATRRIAIGIFFGMLGVLMQSFTEWTFRQTQIFLTFHVLAGVLASLYALKRDARKAAPEETDEEPVETTADLEPIGSRA
jgi:hypothetical protein